MRQLAQKTNVHYQENERKPQLLEAPVFRYDDQPRRFLDATMWVWTDGGRPVAFEKIEAMDRGRPQWATLFTSVSEGLLTVQWDESREYRSTSPGVDFRPLPSAPDVPARSSAQRLAAREVVRGFSARILTDVGPDKTEEMRLLPAPIFEYTDPETKQFRGAIFGLTTGGTNPDVLILLEPRESGAKSVWNYSVTRMTTCGVTLRYGEATVWKAEFCLPPANTFPTWTVFYTRRQEIEDESAEGDPMPPRARTKDM
ncbi:MAG TPA: hypothetical protein VG826_11435 [Pirellulales bacterium]|nr:hypothetical protein [Pirellulales bacterium]